ncbi:hypothetical protein AB0O28_09975 [Microbispora sp. NPDC088329]|uniref:hypothetical protein n=1 Tax=Microbispora sp. NPDC088329 TaxID=3154869 RepID=UPI00341F735F
MFEFLADLVDMVTDLFDGDSGTPDVPSSDVAQAPAQTASDEVRFGSAAGCDCGFNPNTCGSGWACRWQY